MAKYSVTHTCDHNVEHQLYGKYDGRQREIERLQAQACTECYRQSQQQQAQQQTAELGLPDLHGSDKQIAWAMTIRASKQQDLADTRKLVEDNAAKDPARAEQVLAILTSIVQQTSAAWWIDHRYDTAQAMAREAYSN